MPNQHGKYYNNAYKIVYRTHRITVTKCLNYKPQHEQPQMMKSIPADLCQEADWDLDLSC